MTDESVEQPNTEETPKPAFYSNLSRQIEHKFPRVLNHTPESTPQEQARKFFSNPSLSPDEVNHHKIHDFINASDGPIYRSDLLKHVNGLTPQLKDTVLQRKPLEWSEEQLPNSNTTVHNADGYQIIPTHIGDDKPQHMINRLSDGRTFVRDSLEDAKKLAK